MGDLLPELEKRRESELKAAEEAKNRRDSLNAEAKAWADKRDEYNVLAKELLEQAAECKKKRNSYNKKAKEAKRHRDELGKQIAELRKKLDSMKKKFLPRNGKPLGRLKKELKELEFKQMTTVLSPQKEKELIDLLAKIKAEIDRKEKILLQNEEVKATMAKIEELKEKADDWHAKVENYASLGQKEHDKMVELYDKALAVRKEADMYHQKYLKAKSMADDEHRKYIEHMRMVKDLDKIITGLKQKERWKKPAGAEKVIEELFRKFKKGEKLSTEDLFMLQKAGKI